MNKHEHFFINGQAAQSEPLHYRACGLDNIFLLNGFEREEVDGEEYVTIHDMDGLWKAIGIHLVLHQKTLNPQEVRFLRRHMKMTQAELAKDLRVTDQTVARWEKGEANIPGPADFALRTAFLLSPAAQPEGKKIVQEIIERFRELSDTDETSSPKAVFSQKGHRWKEVSGRKAA
jgi:DNA-binding transcriptional regulator YiaG